MRALIIAGIVVVNFILQSTVLHRFALFDVVPNTGLIIIVAFAILRGEKIGGLLGIVTGLLHDITFHSVIGVNALIYFFIGYTIGLMHEKIFKENLVAPFFFAGISTVIYHLLYYVFMFFFMVNTTFMSIAREIILIEMAYNAIVAVLIYKQISKLYKKPRMRFGTNKRR